MLRWNGYGEESITYPLSDSAIAYFRQKLGDSQPPQDVRRESLIIPPPDSFPNPHPLIQCDDETRLRHALGQSFPDLVAKRFGKFARFPDAVAFPESNSDVTDLLAWARTAGVQVIPFGGGTSVVGGVNPMQQESNDRPILTICMARMNDLRNLDTESHLATFGAGT